MERITKFYPAYDKRNADPSKNYGIHGVDLRMVLKGELGAVQFVLYTNWFPKSIKKDLLNDSPNQTHFIEKYPFMYVMEPMAVDVGYHSPHPIYEGQEPMGSRNIEESIEKMKLEIDLNLTDMKIELIEPTPTIQKNLPICEYLGVPCYYDGSGLRAEVVYEVLCTEGSDGVWKYLEKEYIKRFNELR